MKEDGKESVVSEQEKEEQEEEKEVEIEDSPDDTIEASEKNEESFSNEKKKEENDSELEAKIEQLTEEIEQMKDRLLRSQAEFENYKRRTQKEKIKERQYKSEELATEILPVLDSFERALHTEISEENKSFMEGMQMVYNQLLNALQSQGVKQIETVDREFDPTIHHAVLQIEDEDRDSNIIVEELQKGYMLKDKVIRPAMVKVNK